jgi:hypothetical protein
MPENTVMMDAMVNPLASGLREQPSPSSQNDIEKLITNPKP